MCSPFDCFRRVRYAEVREMLISRDSECERRCALLQSRALHSRLSPERRRRCRLADSCNSPDSPRHTRTDEMAGTGDEEGDTVACRQWVLPAREFEGLWQR